MATKTLSPLMRKYNALRRAKKSFCQGKKTKAQVETFAKSYVAAAVKKGQTAVEANKKANAVLKGGCKISSVAGKKPKTAKATVSGRKPGRPKAKK